MEKELEQFQQEAQRLKEGRRGVHCGSRGNFRAGPVGCLERLNTTLPYVALAPRV
ncbi:hypothetical protein JY651_04055 [Pyxidicoccus parkwayensis]|uniref:Uncharacterized protein n=1 Tax=Pyxidicoccus parkwayensis TaxID=2813578 RepID=A0ABX7PE03_9BACT|nr:hypothetical protein [Pyxidicoccus parkwaysis]QSQ28632.1 hypothetical protein JY651_04055 [Pyxidicoccus parkwaysis]